MPKLAANWLAAEGLDTTAEHLLPHSPILTLREAQVNEVESATHFCHAICASRGRPPMHFDRTSWDLQLHGLTGVGFVAFDVDYPTVPCRVCQQQCCRMLT